MDFDCERQTYSLKIDGRTVNAAVPFAEKIDTVERIVFRTGPWRGQVPPAEMESGGERPSGIDTEDRPGADTRLDRASSGSTPVDKRNSGTQQLRNQGDS
jgi:hypothetical protein